MRPFGERDRHRPSDPPEGIGDVVRALLEQGAMRRGVSVGRLARAWEEVAGPELAVETAPKALEGGALLVAASSPGWGTRARFLAEEIRRRANDTLGREEVVSVTVFVAADARKPLRGNDSGAQGPPDGTPGTGSPG